MANSLSNSPHNTSHSPMQKGSQPATNTAVPLRIAMTENGLAPVCIGGEDYYSWIDRAASRLGIHSEDLVSYVLGIISRCNPNLNTETANAMLATVVEAEPKDPQELLLLCQMTAINNMAMDTLADAAKARTLEHKEHEIGIVSRLMGLYSRQMETLNKYRKQSVLAMQVVSNNAVIGNVYHNNANS